MFGLWGKDRLERRIERQRELAEMENTNLEIKRKGERLRAVLEEMTEKKRGQNDR